MAENKVVYLKAKRNVQVVERDVFLKNIASVSCTDELLLSRIRTLKIYHFPENGSQRVVISSLKLIAMISKIDASITVENIGEQDTLIRLIKAPEKKGIFMWLKVIFVSLISFFGTAFTIMAFHNDIGIHDVFGRIYEQVLGRASDGFSILELMYSFGLAVGIALFFNHVGARRITNDPTPIEVEMRIYEKDVDDTLIENADREGKINDVT